MKSIFREFIKAKELLIEANRSFLFFKKFKDSKFLLRALENCYKSNVLLIVILLKKAHIDSLISLEKNPNSNLKIFYKNYKKFNLTIEDLKIIKETFKIYELHKKSGYELALKDYFIFDDDMNKVVLNSENIDKYIKTSLKLLESSQSFFRGNFRKV